MKRIHSFRSMGYAALSSEASALGAKAALSAQTFDSVIRGGSMDCGFYRTSSSMFSSATRTPTSSHSAKISRNSSGRNRLAWMSHQFAEILDYYLLTWGKFML